MASQYAHEEDYFRGILGDGEVEDALKELARLTKEEELIVAAHTNVIVRQGEY